MQLILIVAVRKLDYTQLNNYRSAFDGFQDAYMTFNRLVGDGYESDLQTLLDLICPLLFCLMATCVNQVLPKSVAQEAFESKEKKTSGEHFQRMLYTQMKRSSKQKDSNARVCSGPCHFLFFFASVSLLGYCLFFFKKKRLIAVYFEFNFIAYVKHQWMINLFKRLFRGVL